ncbi:hypothetical protein DMC30DRAFT_404422, partial [Rhodotorula diobovata]
LTSYIGPAASAKAAMDPVDPHTLAFLSRLPLVLAPLPPAAGSLSSAAADKLAALTQGSHSTTRGTSCGACRAQVVGGVNGSLWVERGELWATCGRPAARVARRAGAHGARLAQLVL